MDEPKYEGVSMKIGGRELVIPPLSLKQVQKLYPTIEALQKESDPLKSMEAVSLVVHAALKRNYPEMTLDEVDDMLDLGNFKAVIETVMGVSGFLARGEMKAGNVPTGA